MLFGPPKILGIILDISLREFNGKKILEDVRSKLINYITSLDQEDGMYLFHNEIIDISYKRGEQIANLANFNTDGFKIDLSYALKQSLFILGATDNSINKKIILITDHLIEKDKSMIRKFLSLNKKDDFNCRLVIFNLGKNIDCNDLDVDYYESPMIDYCNLQQLFPGDVWHYKKHISQDL